MPVDVEKNLGMAFLSGHRLYVRCLRGRRSGPVKQEPCGYRTELNLESIIWTRGAQYPLWKLPSRLKCPRCGGTSVEVSWWPGASPGERAGRDLVQCADAARRE